jgi:cell division protein FtsL
MRRVPQQYANSNVRRERDPRAARRQMLLLASCLLLAAGFVFAARQQILAVEYGYKTEALRREREQLLDEQRRLLLAVEESSSPSRLEQAARELGMQPAHAEQIETMAGQTEAARRTEEQRPASRVLVGAATPGTVLRR